ncbi:MAG: DNA helicase, partial [Anaerolineae bacterium]|nr:DNA helicase [Anaerolineae bacterium]
GATNGAPSAYDLLKKLEAERAAHEDERLLYVAATRAIRRLHLVGVAVADERMEGGLKPPASGTLLKLLWPAVAEPVFSAALAAGPVPAPTTGTLDPASFVPPLVRLTEVALPEALREVPGSLGPAGNSVDLDATESRLSLEASVGTLVHRCLELVARDGLEHWSATRVKALAPA